MADRSLNPATRSRHGGPSPRRQPDGPRPHPPPPGLWREGHAAFPRHPVLIPVSRGYPGAGGRLGTCYSPVRHSMSTEVVYPFDLHVLSTPPAFILSQDQTLRSNMGRAPLPSPESLIRHCPAHGVPIGGAAGPRGDPSSSLKRLR